MWEKSTENNTSNKAQRYKIEENRCELEKTLMF